MSTCAEHEPLLRRFLAGPLPEAERTRLRAHLADCTACRESYAEGARAAAAIGRARREGRRLEERAERRARLHPVALASPAQRRAGLRPLVYTALVAALLLALGRGAPASRGRILPELGAVRAGARTLVEPAPLRQGERVETAPGGRARLVAGEAEAVLGPETVVLVERTLEPRLRLVRGELELRGAVAVPTARGVVEVGEGGAARVRLAAGVLQVDAATPPVRVVSPRGIDVWE